MKKASFAVHLLMLGVFTGMTVSHIMNGYLLPSIMTAMVAALFIPGVLLGKE